MEYRVEELKSKAYPMDLLLSAEPDEKTIHSYIYESEVFNAVSGSETLGVIVLQARSGGIIEIRNLAVSDTFQNRKVARALLEKAIDFSRENGYAKIIIRTGATSTHQFLFYQKMGFRLCSVDYGYFERHYRQPVFENGVQCVDQLILEYPLYSREELEKRVCEFWDAFLVQNDTFRNEQFDLWSFGYGSYQANSLLNLVREGKKRGTSSAYELYCLNDESLPLEGGVSVVTYGNGLPGCIIRTTRITVRKFCDITSEQARLEGEGDLSLGYWRTVHEEYFRKEYLTAGLDFHDEIPVLYEEFEVLFQ